jgi:tetratricopeptide (TPR) repeat protein
MSATPDALLAQALERHRAGDTQGAEALYRTILHGQRTHFDAQRLLGLESHDRALAINAGHADAYYNRGNVKLALGRPEAALADYDAMLRLAPGFLPALNNKALALLHLERPAEALPLLDRVLTQQPGFALAQANRGTACLNLGRAAEAVASFDKALALAPGLPEAQTGLERARAMLAQGTAST